MSLFDSLKRLLGLDGNGDMGAAQEAQGITCQDALRFMHEFIDGELEGVSRAEVQAHFEVCKLCYPHLRLERCYREALQRAYCQETAPVELRERVLDIASGGGSAS